MSKVFEQPLHSGDYPDRHLDCQSALDVPLRTIIEYAEASGWKFEEVGEAIIELLWNMRIQRDEMLRTQADIDRIVRDRRMN